MSVDGKYGNIALSVIAFVSLTIVTVLSKVGGNSRENYTLGFQTFSVTVEFNTNCSINYTKIPLHLCQPIF